MANKYFRFKQFTVEQERCAMKVGTDGVLLGAWVSIPAATARVLDIGTGTGLIALMAAQRAPMAYVDAVEIESEAAEQAKENVKNSPWSNRVAVFETAVQEFAPQYSYDIIVSNPPYFIRSLKNESLKKSIARHNDMLPLGELAASVKRLLAADGIFAAILPYEEANLFIAEAAGEGLFLQRRLDVRGRKAKPVKRVLMEFARKPAERVDEKEMYLENEDNSRSRAYSLLTADFYL